MYTEKRMENGRWNFKFGMNHKEPYGTRQKQLTQRRFKLYYFKQTKNKFIVILFLNKL